MPLRNSAHFSCWLLLITFTISSCSVEISQTTGTTPSPTGLSPTTQLPVPWSRLNLKGKLIYLSSTRENDIITSSVQMLNLATGGITTIFSLPSAWIYYATISPDAKSLVMSYAPPIQSNSSPPRILYIMPLDGTAPPQPLFTPPTADDRYTQAEWSPDGKHIYFVQYNVNGPTLMGPAPVYAIFRMTYPNGQPEKIVEHAFWPRLSPDSTRIVYASQDLNSDRNELFLANADGSAPQRVAFSGPWKPKIIDAPIFSPDGQSILFSVPTPAQAYQPNWFEKLMGVEVARAHNVPSDWWSVPVTEGVPTQLTNIQTINLFASISPDEQHLASVSGEGLFVMELDGSNLTQLIFDPGVYGTVSWIP